MSVVASGVKIDSTDTMEYKSNPKRVNCNAWNRYNDYQAVTSYDEYIAACNDSGHSKFAKADLAFDIEKGHLTIIREDGTKINKPIDDAARPEEKPAEEFDEATAEEMEELNEAIKATDEAEEVEVEATSVEEALSDDNLVDTEEATQDDGF